MNQQPPHQRTTAFHNAGYHLHPQLFPALQGPDTTHTHSPTFGISDAAALAQQNGTNCSSTHAPLSFEDIFKSSHRPTPSQSTVGHPGVQAITPAQLPLSTQGLNFDTNRELNGEEMMSSTQSMQSMSSMPSPDQDSVRVAFDHTGLDLARPTQQNKPLVQLTPLPVGPVNSQESTTAHGLLAIPSSSTMTTASGANGKSERKKRIRNGNGPHPCPHCDKQFKYKTHLNRHMATHQSTPLYTCTFRKPNGTLCNRGFYRKDHYEYHKNQHSTTRPFSCTHEGCASDFRQASALRRHVRRVHKKAICSVCNEQFPDKATLDAHTHVHSARYREKHQEKASMQAITNPAAVGHASLAMATMPTTFGSQPSQVPPFFNSALSVDGTFLQALTSSALLRHQQQQNALSAAGLSHLGVTPYLLAGSADMANYAVVQYLLRHFQ